MDYLVKLGVGLQVLTFVTVHLTYLQLATLAFEVHQIYAFIHSP